jgi:hypothetical protein
MHEQFLLPALYQRLASMLYFETLLGAAPLFPIAAALPAIDPNDDDFACFCSYREHDSSSWVSKKQYNIKVTGVREWISLETDTDVPLTTLCNGQPRALESYKSFEVTSTETPDLSGTTARYATPTFTTAKSACSHRVGFSRRSGLLRRSPFLRSTATAATSPIYYQSCHDDDDDSHSGYARRPYELSLEDYST